MQKPSHIKVFYIFLVAEFELGTKNTMVRITVKQFHLTQCSMFFMGKNNLYIFTDNSGNDWFVEGLNCEMHFHCSVVTL